MAGAFDIWLGDPLPLRSIQITVFALFDSNGTIGIETARRYSFCTLVISTDPNTRIIISSPCWAITAVPSYRRRNPSSHHDVALKLAKRLEIHFTPKHGSWLNIAKIELSAMTKQCLDKRIATIEELQTQVSAWESKRNADTKSVDWQFSTDDARIKTNRRWP
jgi:hypothetical protein